ncbi:MAG: type II secretion system protein [Lachnospiraceae bacterium]|nr:type II secretion system protein [Lachnospiraceae bacterium]
MSRGRQRAYRQNGGFTLVELIVVFVIIVLLAAVITPAMLGFIDSSKREREVDHAKALYSALNNRLTTLYDQGIMPNQDFNGYTNNGTAGFHWREDWTADIIYNSGIPDKPYICGFFTGNLTKDAGTGNYLGAGLSGLKKGYHVYAMVYVEKQDSEPVIYYDGNWDRTSLSGVMDDGTITLENGEKIFRSRMCTMYGCTGNKDNLGNAIETYNELRDEYKAVP